MTDLLQHTESLCPVCLKRIPARYVCDNNTVLLQKTCPAHGSFATKVWQGVKNFNLWQRPKIHMPLPYAVNPVAQGCPFDCGLCKNHKQRSCTVLLEITQRCNINCAVCFAHNSPAHEPNLATLTQWYQTAQKSNPHVNIQLSGGEPTLRRDLKDIIALGVQNGIGFIQLNTNGVLLAQKPALAQELARAGLASVFLQFDGTHDDIFLKLRNRPLLEIKRRAIANCAAAGLGVVLVPTLAPGVNTNNIGAILKFALQNTPTVKGVHFQPISYFGRYPQTPQNNHRITLPELMTAIEAQTSGLFLAQHFNPPGCENALCSMHANYILLGGGRLLSLNHANCCYEPADAGLGSAKAVKHTARKWRGGALAVNDTKPNVPDFSPANPHNVDLDEFLERGQTHSFMVSAMAFQDAWTLDLQRLRECCVHIMSPQGKLMPFCAYNLTNINGEALYRHA